MTKSESIINLRAGSHVETNSQDKLRQTVRIGKQ